MRKILLILSLILLAALWGCSSSDDDGPATVTPEDEAAADVAATETMGDLLDDMDAALGDEYTQEDVDALMEMDLSAHRDGFQSAIELDPTCGPAHFGLAFVEMVTMAQEDDMQDLIDDFGTEFGELEMDFGLPEDSFSTQSLLSGGMMGRSFEILRRSPLALSPRKIELGRLSSDKSDRPLIRDLQTYIHYFTLPATQRIVNHLAVAESDPDFNILIVNGGAEPDTVEIDLGEVYVLDAVVRALRAGLQIATAYDVELAPNGDYGWITDNFIDYGYTGYEVVDMAAVPDTLTLFDDDHETILREAALYEGFEDLLEPGSYFLTLWTDPWSGETAMNAAYAEIGTLLSKLESAYEFILAEEDDQSNDAITQVLLAELDGAIATMSDDLPDYIGTWETVPDVIAWVEEVLAGPYTIPVPINETETFNLTVNVSALFLNPVDDWKTKLPYMEWIPVEEWATFDEVRVFGPYSWNPDNPYSTRVDAEDMSFLDIGTYYFVESRWETSSALVFLDGPGGEPYEGEFYYFPDYTFGGLFPGMNRDGWLTLATAD